MVGFLCRVDSSYKKEFGKDITWRSDEFQKTMSYEMWISDQSEVWLNN